jgi:hypothetical protein
MALLKPARSPSLPVPPSHTARLTLNASAGRRIVVEQRVIPAAKVPTPLAPVMPMQHGFEAILFFLFNLGHVKLSRSAEGPAP